MFCVYSNINKHKTQLNIYCVEYSMNFKKNLKFIEYSINFKIRLRFKIVYGFMSQSQRV